MYVENVAFFTFTKIGQVASKKLFPLVYKTNRVMRINSSIEVLYFQTITALVPFLVVSAGFPWLSLVIAGYPGLPHGYVIQPRLQKISTNDGKDNCKCTNDFIYIGIAYNQG